MRIDVVTLFPSLVEQPLSESIVGKARSAGFLKLGFANPRDFASDRHKTVDDRPYGGGPGMLMMAEPVYRAVRSVKKRNSLVILLDPHGKRFDQNTASSLSGKKHIVLVCGHYEGIDSRLSKEFDMVLSMGDYVLTGGEPAAVAVIDCITRLLPGVLKKKEAVLEESFGKDRLLECPQYTRPAVWRGMKVPGILISGDHKKIAGWRAKQAVSVTKKLRPDLIHRTTKEKCCHGY